MTTHDPQCQGGSTSQRCFQERSFRKPFQLLGALLNLKGVFWLVIPLPRESLQTANMKSKMPLTASNPWSWGMCWEVLEPHSFGMAPFTSSLGFSWAHPARTSQTASVAANVAIVGYPTVTREQKGSRYRWHIIPGQVKIVFHIITG